MTQEKSYRQILRSTSIIGGAAVVNVLIGLLRIKVVAVLLGPSGVGLIGLYSNIMSTAATLAGLGFGNVGTRQIAQAAAQNDAQAIAKSRRALFWGTLILALVGGLGLWLAHDLIAQLVFGHADLNHQISWLALGTALSIAAASQSALLNGLRCIRALAQVNILSAIFSTIIGLIVLWYWGQQALIAFVVIVPCVTFCLGHLYVARLPKIHAPATSLRELSIEWWSLARLGFAFMSAGVVGLCAQLMVRSLVQHQLGIDALGYFQAAWVLSMTYIGLILQAMSADFYPRLTAVIHDHEQVNRLVNEQTEIALFLAGPVFLGALAFSPWIIHLLYAPSFAPAGEILRWQVLGDIFKIASFPLGFIILAAGDGGKFFLTDMLALTTFALLTWIGLPWFGLKTTGISFLIMYALHFSLVYWLGWRRTRFSWTSRIKHQFCILLSTAIIVALAGILSPVLAMVVGGVCMLMHGMYTLIYLSHIIHFPSRINFLVRLIELWLENILMRFKK